ncbi:hypothetical protein INT45_012046 [Circinella minor]|uniref:Tyrosine specific protein phosphatases domain-containing protein n=1 Tax=Circinella minor TaxID=1195481 RepID=A0A8H7VQV6_9FUNG|nr:hypothetical protein INT45_012046 [Circinella minor]
MSSADSLPPPLQTDSPELKAPPVVASGQSRVNIDSTPGLRSVPKTSISHPINISWIIPHEYCPLLSLCDLPDDIDLYDLTDAVLQSEYVPKLIMACQATPDRPLARPMGNLALSSCPGKKVRLTGPSRGRAAINRDLDLDFGRMRSLGITTLVCCLNDTELDFLGASWPKYCESATRNGMQVIRLPMIEGGCPNSIEEIDAVIQAVNVKIRQGENVLAHCRGGVGRAGVFACCWLLKNLYCLSGERSIRYVRTRRSPKAIETMRQAEFIIHYSQYISHTLEQRQQQQLYHLHYNDAQKDRQEQEQTINSNSNINMNNFDYPVNNHESSTAIATTWTPLELLNTDYTISVPSIIDIMFLEQSIRETDHRPYFPYYYHQPPQQSDKSV